MLEWIGKGQQRVPEARLQHASSCPVFEEDCQRLRDHVTRIYEIQLAFQVVCSDRLSCSCLIHVSSRLHRGHELTGRRRCGSCIGVVVVDIRETIGQLHKAYKDVLIGL